MSEQEAYVVSDLHLGDGISEPQLEDFDRDELLARFIQRIAREGVTLFLAGDTFDFVQIPPYDLAPVDHLLWDEATSVRKLEAALRAHSRVVDALSGFVAAGGRLRLLEGNHDVDLRWPAVQRRLREALGAARDEEALAFEPSHIVHHGVHIEHGHAFTPENAPRDVENVIHVWPEGDPAGRRYLERIWGTDFMLRFYNTLEREYPFADSVKPTLSLLWYGIKNRWVGAREVIRLVMFLKRAGVPLAGITSAVLAPESAGLPQLVGSLAEDEWGEVLEERAAADPEFASDVASVLADLPREQRALFTSGERAELGLVTPSLVAPPSATLGVFREDRERRAAKKRLAKPGVTHVIFGHTHKKVDGALDHCLYNIGSWHPHLDLGSADVKAKIEAHGITLDMLRDPSLYRVEPWVARIVADPPRRSHVELVRADAI